MSSKKWGVNAVMSHDYQIVIDVDVYGSVEETEEQAAERLALQVYLTRKAWEFMSKKKNQQNLMNQILGNDGILIK